MGGRSTRGRRDGGFHTRGWVSGGSLLLAACLLPAGLPAQTAAPPVLEVPLHHHEGRLWVPVRGTDGTELRFLLSTGVPYTMFSETGARRQEAAGALTIGGLPGAPVDLEGAQTLGDDALTHGGERFDGMLAPNTLSAFDVLLDAPGGRMLLRPVGPPVSWEGYELSRPVRLQVYHGVVIALQVAMGGTGVPAMLELGTPVVLGNPAVGDAGAIVDGRAPSLEIGGATWTDLPAEVRDHPSIRRFSPEGDPFVIVGGVIAVDCALSISWVRTELRTCVR
ncbi:MAG TPA: hypothetical protein VK858_02275 [Longimicrobiales bacterium]|nr:hypothetical protein [Longimicrobiales bacterium]